MSSDTYSLVKRVGAKLRYQELPDLIGKAVVIRSLDTVEMDVREELFGFIPGQTQLIDPDREHQRKQLAKYDLLDLSFLVEGARLPDNAAGGFQLLRTLGFVPKDEKRLQAGERVESIAEDPTCIAELDGDIQKNEVLLRVFLKGDRTRKLAERITFRLPDSYFPVTLEIMDACLTNAGNVWLWKHFYL